MSVLHREPVVEPGLALGVEIPVCLFAFDHGPLTLWGFDVSQCGRWIACQPTGSAVLPVAVGRFLWPIRGLVVAKVTRLSWLRFTRVVMSEKPSRPHARDDCAKIFTALLGTAVIIRLASRQLSLDGQADELGTVAVTVVAALLHQAIDGFHHFTLNALDQAYGIGQASRVAAHGSALLSVWKSEAPAFAGAVRVVSAAGWAASCVAGRLYPSSRHVPASLPLWSPALRQDQPG